MKTRILFSVILLSICIPGLFSQIPQKINYQAVVRNASGDPITETTVGIRLSIFTPTKGGLVCVEEFSPTTNEFGLITLEIGSVNTVDFQAIDWSTEEYYLKVELDESGGTDYTEMGTAQLVSVPYALHAETAEVLLGDEKWQTSGSDIYYNEGNVGIGTVVPSIPLDINAPAISNTSEIIVNMSVNDDPASYLKLKNSTISDGKYMPAIEGFNGTDHRQSLFIVSKTTDVLDDLANYPLITFDARREESAIVNRPLFQWSSYGNHKMTMLADGSLGLGTISPATKLNVEGGTDASLSTGSGYVQIGATTATNLLMDNNEIMVRNNGSASPLYLQHDGGDLYMHLNSSGSSYVSFRDDGKVGIGTSNPEGKLQVEGGGTWDDEVPLFAVKNDDGIPVFAVFNNGIRIIIDDTYETPKGPKGGFAIGGYDYTKAGETVDFMRITSDSIRFNINNESDSKGPKGGFAIGGFDHTKGDINEDFMYITPQASDNGLYNTFLGFQAGENNTGEHNTFIGTYAGNTNGIGSYNNFIGLNAGYSNTQGSSNCFIGNSAGQNNTTGYGNVFLGNGGGVNNSEGFNNVYIGTNAGLWQTTGDYNIIIGPQWGGSAKPERDNTIKIGARAGFEDTGSDRLFIDGSSNGTTYSTSLIYGYYGEGEHHVRINGNLSYTGSFGVASDSQLKTDMERIDDALGKINYFDGYYFQWNEEAIENMEVSDTRQIGVIAQEVESVFPELISENEEGYKTVDYIKLTPILLQAIKEQQSQLEEMEARIARLEEMISGMTE